MIRCEAGLTTLVMDVGGMRREITALYMETITRVTTEKQPVKYAVPVRVVVVLLLQKKFLGIRAAAVSWKCEYKIVLNKFCSLTSPSVITDKRSTQ